MVLGLMISDPGSDSDSGDRCLPGLRLLEV